MQRRLQPGSPASFLCISSGSKRLSPPALYDPARCRPRRSAIAVLNSLLSNSISGSGLMLPSPRGLVITHNFGASRFKRSIVNLKGCQKLAGWSTHGDPRDRFPIAQHPGRVPESAVMWCRTFDVIPGSIGRLIFRLETFGHAVWQKMLWGNDVLYCVKYHAYY